MRIGFDLDDTLTNNELYARTFCENYFKRNNLSFNLIKEDTALLTQMYDWNKEQFEDFWLKEGVNFLSNAPARKGAQALLNQLKRDGHEVYIITQRSWGEAYDVAKTWLENNNIPFDMLVVNAYDKLEACRDFNVSVYLDDRVKYVDNLNKNGIYGIVMNTHFNKDETTKAKRIDYLDEFYHLIKNFKQQNQQDLGLSR